jgi:hypothetical protein
VAYAEAVEKWARERGGHAKLKWLPPPMACWAVILEYRTSDPRKASKNDGEPVLLHDYWTADEWARRAPGKARRHKRTNAIMAGNYAYELDELGTEGIIQRLDRGNILSGRGEFRSVEHAGAVADEQHAAFVERARTKAKDEAGARARDKRRSLYRIPFLRVGIDLSGFLEKKQKQSTQPTE